ncbi:MAG TPA: hypothetical protein VN541_01315, partial [Tepidisphaeraceae bacterium]|nr:hypothetical protein [Tepidisphaeraceae bacterium]
AAAGRHERQKMDLRPCFDSGVFELCQISTPEETAFYVKLATQMSDGEAMSVAIASCRGWSVATDDMPARRAAAGLKVKAYCTPQLLRIWAESNGVPAVDVANAIEKIEVLARYVPRADLPDADWWSKRRTR